VQEEMFHHQFMTTASSCTSISSSCTSILYV